MAAGVTGFILLVVLGMTVGEHKTSIKFFDLSSPEATLHSFREALKDDRTLSYAYRCLSASMQRRYPYYSGFYPFFSRVPEGILLRKVLLGSQRMGIEEETAGEGPRQVWATVTFHHRYSSRIPLTLREARYVDPQTGNMIHQKEWKIDLDINDYVNPLQRWYHTLTPDERREIDRVPFRERTPWDTFRHRR